MENPWGIRWESMENIITYKMRGESVGDLWRIRGESVGNPWKIKFPQIFFSFPQIMSDFLQFYVMFNFLLIFADFL